MSKISEFIQSKINQYIAHRKKIAEDRRLIERERSMININSIFLVDDFLTAAVNPLAKQDQQFRRRYSQSIKKWLAPSSTILPIRFVPFSKVQNEKLKQSYIDPASKNVDNFLKPMLEGMEPSLFQSFLEIENVSSVDEYKKKYIDLEMKELEFPAFRIGDLASILELCAFSEYEDQAIKRGNGEHILNFWKAVNNLDDYQTLFPDNHGGGSNKRDQKKNPLISFLPALN